MLNYNGLFGRCGIIHTQNTLVGITQNANLLLSYFTAWYDTKRKTFDACVKARVHQWLTVQRKYMYLSLMLPARVRHTSELHAMLPRMPTQISYNRNPKLTLKNFVVYCDVSLSSLLYSYVRMHIIH